MVLWKFIVRHVLSRRVRTLLTLLSIVIGVAAIVSVNIATQTTDRAYREMFAAVTGRAQLEVVDELGGAFEEGMLGKVAAMPEVGSAAPLLQRSAILYVKGRKIQSQGMGIDPGQDAAIRDYEIKEGGFGGDGKPSGVLLESGFAKNLDLHVGDEFSMLAGRGKRKVTVSGILTFRGAATLRMGGMVFFRLPKAQSVFNAKDELDMIQVVLKNDQDIDKAKESIQSRLPKGLTVRKPAGGSQMVRETLLASQQGLELASAFSLLLAGFIILNTFLMNVGERRRQLAIMRAVGATRRQIERLLYTEAVLFGLAGTILGILAGLLGANLLTQATNRLLQLNTEAMKISDTPFILLLGAAFGMGVSLLGVIIPALRARKVSPLEGMGVVSREDTEGHSHRITLIGTVICVLAGSVLTGCIMGWLPMDYAVTASVCELVGMVFVLPVILDSLSWVVAGLFGLFIRGEARLARRQILRHRARSTLTVGVLFVATSTGVGLANAIMDNVRDVKIWKEQALVGDFFVRAMMPNMGDWKAAQLPEEVDAEIRKVQGIESLDTTRFVQIQLADQKPVIILRNFTDPNTNYFDLEEGDPRVIRAQLEEGQVVVGTVLAQKLHLKAGDTIPLETRDGSRQIKIAGLTNEYMVGGLAIYMHRAVAEKLFPVAGVDAYIVKSKPEDRALVEKQLRDLCDRHGLMLHSYAEISGMVDGMIAGIDGCLWGILVLGVFVSTFGVINTLTMNVLEQTRELGMLRIVAMTRRQVRRTILTQAAIIGAIGVFPGVAAGVAVAYLIHLGTMPATGHPVEFILRPGVLTLSLIGGFLIVVASAWLPAERAARLELLQALHYE
jgi:putative ABC transport system permease protein